jgi:hypothetical protein
LSRLEWLRKIRDTLCFSADSTSPRVSEQLSLPRRQAHLRRFSANRARHPYRDCTARRFISTAYNTLRN